jgi:hypothetical protein
MHDNSNINITTFEWFDFEKVLDINLQLIIKMMKVIEHMKYDLL